MKKFDSNLKNLAYLGYRFIAPVFNPVRFYRGIVGYPWYIRDLVRYSFLENSEKIKFSNLYPIIEDKGVSNPFDSHYFYQDVWAFKKIYKSGVPKHIDVGSRIDFVGFTSAVTDVDYVDIRPLETDLPNIKYINGSILKLPFSNDSVGSLSCLHTVEHIGLGRYGDPLDPMGTKKACSELERVLSVGGHLYFSTPIGRPRVCFNAHRIHSPEDILKYFSRLRLVDFSAIDDRGHFCSDVKPRDFLDSNYSCGLFHFTK